MDSRRLRRITGILLVLTAIVALASIPLFAQRLDGTLRGEVTDPTGAVVADAKVTATSVATGVANQTKTSSSGIYVFPNLLVGTYNVAIEAPHFRKYVRTNVEVKANQVTEAHAKLAVGAATETVEVTAGAELIQTETSQLTNTFQFNQLQTLTAGGQSPLDLAIFLPNTTATVGGTAGTGGSVGGTRPRMNNFTIDGVDDNDVSVTGPVSTVIQDAIQELTVVTNQFSAEYGHSAGGQFTLVSKSGTNNWHGDGFWYTENRGLNALTNLDKIGGLTRDTMPRYDRNIGGASVGGPLMKDKIFVFGAFQKDYSGSEGSTVANEAPTAAGLTALQGLALNSSVTDILNQFPVAGSSTRTQTVNRLDNNGNIVATAQVPIGLTTFYVPNFYDEWDFHVNGDLVLNKHRVSTRYLYNHYRSPNVPTGISLPQFTGAYAYDVRKALVKDTWTINDRLASDFTVGYTRVDGGNYTVPAAFANFPNVTIKGLTNFVLGPQAESPQGGLMNTYQVGEQMSLVRGRHTFKFGGEFRKWIGGSDFLPRSRGDWQYNSLDELVSDLVPSTFAKRGAGSGAFVGNQSALYWFVQDDLKVSTRLTLNLGLRYEFVSNPKSDSWQTLNSIASLPGTPMQFTNPKTDRNNFAPRIGFAWDPTGQGKWSVRGGFGIAYDVTYQNLPLLELPPQLQSEQDPNITCSLPGAPAWCPNYHPSTTVPGLGQGFLSDGGLLSVATPPATVADARKATQGIIGDTVAPRIMTWSLGIQRELSSKSSLEIRYLGTDSRNLPIQVQANSITAFENGARALPLYFSAADIPTTFSNTAPTLAQFNSFIARPYANILSTNPVDCPGKPVPCVVPGFQGSVTYFPPWGTGTYHGGSVTYNQRVWHGLQMQANYTFSKNIDNATNELFTSSVNPRRSEDWRNLTAERARSVLDITHKFATNFTYETPGFKDSNSVFRGLFGGWTLGATYLVQSGQPVTIQSFTDANGNKDAAGDRAVFNPAGNPMIGADAVPVCWNGTSVGIGGYPAVGGGFNSCSAAQTMGYVAGSLDANNNLISGANAGYVTAYPGVKTNTARNDIPSPGLNNWNLSFFKRINFTERFNVRFQAIMFNAFNHRQFSYAAPTVFNTNALTGQAQNAIGFVAPWDPTFRNAAEQLNGTSRTMQLGLKLFF